MLFLRDLYLSMNSFRPKIDRYSWKLLKRDYDSFINAGRRQGHRGYSSGSREEDRAPKMVKAVGQLFKLLSALAGLFGEY